SSMSSLKEDTHSIKSMITKMFEAFRGQPSSAPSGNVTPTLALTHIPANVEGENATHTTTEDPPSHIKGETDANKQENFDEPKQSTNVNIEFIVSSTQPSITQAQQSPSSTLNLLSHKEKAKVSPLMSRLRIKESWLKPHLLFVLILMLQFLSPIQ
ncbi:hypothetical protein Tco_0225579, partial [Tanacetum coccineum]